MGKPIENGLDSHVHTANGRVEKDRQLTGSDVLVAIGEVSGSIAHELRNPLGAIKNAVFLLNKRLIGHGAIDSDPEIERYLEMIDRQISRSDQFIQNLLVSVQISRATFDVTYVTAVLEQSLAPLSSGGAVRLLKHLPDDLEPIMGDAGQLRRAFSNLIDNAMEAMPDGGNLTVAARNANSCVEIAFTDTGHGIAEESLAKVFDPLFTTKVRGTGLGLPICRQIVAMHGGTIQVSNNDRPESGATVAVTLPVCQSGMGHPTG